MILQTKGKRHETHLSARRRRRHADPGNAQGFLHGPGAYSIGDLGNVMNQAERIDDLRKQGWNFWRRYANGWAVLSRRNPDELHFYFNPVGLDFQTVFKQGRVATGIIQPRGEKYGM